VTNDVNLEGNAEEEEGVIIKFIFVYLSWWTAVKVYALHCISSVPQNGWVNARA
jgi:hypothetical protein